MKLFKIILPFLLFALISNSTFATVSYEGKESKEISYSAGKLGLKAKEQVTRFAHFSKRVLGNEVGSVGKIDNIIDSAKSGAVKINDVIVSTPNKLDDLKKVVDNRLTVIDIKLKKVTSQIDLQSFFVDVIEVGDKGIIVVEEIGVGLYERHGEREWFVPTDLIENYLVESESIIVNTEGGKLKLSTMSGKKLA